VGPALLGTLLETQLPYAIGPSEGAGQCGGVPPAGDEPLEVTTLIPIGYTDAMTPSSKLASFIT
jgi:hypothetical protein